MPSLSTAPIEPFLSFEKGIDREAARTMLDRGAYEDAQNIVLGWTTGNHKHPTAMKLDSLLDAAVVWPPGNAIWCAPYTYTTYSSQVLTDTTTLVIQRDDGSFWRYTVGAPGVNTIARRGLSTTNQLIVHFTYDKMLIWLNGRDAPMKFGQHLAVDFSVSTPFLIPVGAKLVSPIDPGTGTETWTHGGTGAFVADAAAPGGGARLGTHTLNVKASNNSYVVWTLNANFLTGPQPYGGTNFAGSDFFAIQYYKAAGVGNLRVRFGDDASANYFEFTTATVAGSWQQKTWLRSAATTTGAPDWSAVKRMTIYNDDAAQDVQVDDFYMLYGNAPPAAQVGTTHKQRIVLGGWPTSSVTANTLSSLAWSRASFPDEFPGANVQIISGGPGSLDKTNQITALREYGDAVVIGTPAAVFSWTIGSTGDPSRALITAQFGIDSHRALVETPSGTLLFPWQKALYVIRATGRNYASQKIQPLLTNLSTANARWTVGIVDPLTQTVRVWFQEAADLTKTSNGVVFDIIRSQAEGEAVWSSTMTQMADFAVLASISGTQEVLYVKAGSPQIFRLGSTASGTLASRVRLPWLSRGGRDRLVKWMGLTVPYAATAPVGVYIRYASNPDQFEAAAFTLVQTLPALPGMSEQARVIFGNTARWAQVEFRAATYGMELFPPIELIEMDTQRAP